MNTKSFLLVSLFAAANLAFAAAPVDTTSPRTTSASALHDVQADAATVAQAHGALAPRVAVVSVPPAAALRSVDTLSPTTTSQAALHNTAANEHTTAAVQQAHLERVAARAYATR